MLNFVSSFAPALRRGVAVRATCARPSPQPTMLARSALVDREYQLEELEDSVDSISALYLRADGGVTHGQTDGPVPESMDGEWVYNEDERELVLQLERHFKEGDIRFSVKRVLRGHLDGNDRDGDMAMFAGNIYQDAKDIGDKTAAVGHFSMCDASSDLPSSLSARDMSAESMSQET